MLSIMGFLLGMSSLMPSNQSSRDLSFAAKQLRNQFAFGADEARAQSETIGFVFSQEGVNVVSYDMVTQQWQAKRDKPLGIVAFAEGISADLQLVDTPMSSSQGHYKNGPDVMIQASGEMTLFRVELSAIDVPRKFQLSSDGLNLSLQEI